MPLYRIVLLWSYLGKALAFYISFKRYIHAMSSKKKEMIKLFHNYHSQCARCVTVCAIFHIKQSVLLGHTITENTKYEK